MALKTITPFTYQAFIAEGGESIQKMVDHYNGLNSDFWIDTLRRYTYQGHDYQSGEALRLEFHKDLSSCSCQEDVHAVANKILDWGGMPSLDDDMREGLLPSLSILSKLANGATVDLQQLCVKRLASITKVYEMWDLDNWVIYDSYCVRGLQWLISGFWAVMGYRQNEGLFKLPWPPGRSGSPVNGFPRTADTAPNQQRLGFIYGSWLCKTIAESLRSSDGLHWRTFHVEMLAFQLGHEVQR